MFQVLMLVKLTVPRIVAWGGIETSTGTAVSGISSMVVGDLLGKLRRCWLNCWKVDPVRR